MKARVLVGGIALVSSLSPLAASAAGADSIRACIDSFVAQNLQSRNASFVVDEDRAMQMPLIADTGTRSVKLVASEKDSGRVIATALCKVKDTGKMDSGRSGSVSIGSVDSN